MRALGFDVKKADVLKVLKDYDRDGTGKISFQDFSEVSKSIYVSKTVAKSSPSKVCLSLEMYHVPYLMGEIFKVSFIDVFHRLDDKLLEIHENNRLCCL